LESEDWFSLAELSGRLGELVWVESQLCEIYRLWSRVESHAPAAIFFATTGEHHGWHAEIVRNCLPTSPALDAASAVQAPTTGWLSAIKTLASLTNPDATGPRLKAVTKLIDPWLDREIGALTELGRPVSDAATMRWLRFVDIDHNDDGQVAQGLLAARSDDAIRFDDHVALADIDFTAN